MNENGFYFWLRHQKFSIALAVLCAIVPVLFPLFKLVNEEWITKYTSYIYNICNLVFILGTLFILINSSFLINRKTDKKVRLFRYVCDEFGWNSDMCRCGKDNLFQRMNASIRQFYYSWIVIWVIWLIMYTGKFVYRTGDIHHDLQLSHYEHLFENTLNLLNSFAMFFIYMVITISTVNGSYLNNHRQMHISVVLLIFLGSCCILTDYYSTYLALPSSYKEYQFYIQLFIGIVASMSMMAVLGRLNSSYLAIPQWLIFCLCFYAALQMLYPIAFLQETNEKTLLGDKLEGIAKAIYFLAFLGKICLFLVIRWVMQKRRFLFFLMHKANTMTESEEMLKSFNRSYEKTIEKRVDL